MMFKQISTLLISACLGAAGSVAVSAQPLGEESEPSPEFLDQNFSAEDARRLEEAIEAGRNQLPAEPVSPLRHMLDSADVAFVGMVVNRTYSYDANDVPWTHITFLVTEGIKGVTAGEEFTLIQEGGPTRSGDGGVMVSTSRHFSLDEENMLFVELAESTPDSPMQVMGRFRILNGRMYNEDGYGLLVDSSGQMALSHDRHPDRRFVEIDMGTHKLYKEFGGNRRESDLATGEPVKVLHSGPSYVDSVEVDRFVELIRN